MINNIDKRKNILFKFESGMTCQIITFNRCLLRDDVFPSILAKIGDDKLNIKKLTFIYNCEDKTQHFLNNEPVSSLNLPDMSEIQVRTMKSILPDSTIIFN